MDGIDTARRRALAGGLAAAGAGLLLPTLAIADKKGKGPGEEKEVGAVEDLMREHGVLRRALLVYRETAPKLRGGEVDPVALNRTAKLFRDFGQDYHEKKLEEAFIFPVVSKAGEPAASYPDVLKAQHDRGREVIDYIMAITGKGRIAPRDTENLARVMESFVLMYERTRSSSPHGRRRFPRSSSTNSATSSRRSRSSSSEPTGTRTR
jgi:hypothetical protein